MQKNSKSIMTDICREYLKVAEEKKFEFYRLFSSVPDHIYSKYQGKLSKNEVEVRYASKHLKVKEETVIKFYGDYRTGYYRTDVSSIVNSWDEVIRDLKQSQVFRRILWQRHQLKVEDLERILDFENEEIHKRFDERMEQQQKHRVESPQAFKSRESQESKINVKDRIKELKVLMHRSHPDKGGTTSLFVRYSKELAEIRS